MVTRVRLRTLAALVICTALALPATTASASSADSPEDGLWYYNLYKMDDIHASGIDGTGVTIGVIDSPIYPALPTLKRANVTPNELDCTLDVGSPPVASPTSDDPAIAFHGTDVTSIISGTGKGYKNQIGVPGMAPGAKVRTYAVWRLDPSTGKNVAPVCLGGPLGVESSVAAAITQAVDDGVNIISASVGTSDASIIDAVKYALQHHVIIVSALSNQTEEDDLQTAPATLNGVLSVAAIDHKGHVPKNYQGDDTTSLLVDVAAPGVNMLTQSNQIDSWRKQSLSDGSSYATPFVTAMLALGMQKYPDATPNQLLQSVIHNTGLESHEPELDPSGHFGYGIVDPISFLAADPSQYPDTNPFLEDQSRAPDGDEWGPSTVDVLDTATTSPSATPDASTTPLPTATADPVESGSTTPWIMLVAGLVVLALIAGAVIFIVIATRRNKEGSHGSP